MPHRDVAPGAHLVNVLCWLRVSNHFVFIYLSSQLLDSVMEHVEGEVEAEAKHDGYNVAEGVISSKQQLVKPG